MVQATKEQVVTFNISITEEEAAWLKGIMQNPLFCDHPDKEDSYTKGMRMRFWNALGGNPSVQPMSLDQPPVVR